MIKDLSELQKFLKLCRKQGVKEIKFDGLVVSFGDLPRKQEDDESDEIQTEEPSIEQLMFLSAGGVES